MRKLTRREFGTAAASTVASLTILQGTTKTIADRIGDYQLSEEDKKLAEKFLSNHESNMAPLRNTVLPNGIAPASVFINPVMKRE